MLLKPYLRKKVHIIIDTEYVGKDKQIMKCLQILFEASKFGCDIDFGHVGKKSPAHTAAITSFRGKKNPIPVKVKSIKASQLSILVNRLNKK